MYKNSEFLRYLLDILHFLLYFSDRLTITVLRYFSKVKNYRVNKDYIIIYRIT